MQETIVTYEEREWNGSNKTVLFIMLNPSRADAPLKDPTITRCINFALSWGFGRLEVVNLFAYHTSKPLLLKQATEPIGRDNKRYILESVEKAMPSARLGQSRHPSLGQAWSVTKARFMCA